MSIENNLNRIATALEAIAIAVGNHQPINIEGEPAAPAAPAAAPAFVMTAAANGLTREQYHAAGWTDEQLIQNGMMIAPSFA